MSIEDDLLTLAGQVRPFVDQEVPDEAAWNVNPDVLADALTTIGQAFTTVQAAHAALLALFDADHNAQTGANPVPVEWIADGNTPTFLSASQLRLAGDRRADYAVGHRVRCTLGASQPALGITAVSYDGNQDATTITVEPAVLTSDLSAIARGLVRYSAPRVTSADVMAAAILTDALGSRVVTGPKVALATILAEHLATGAVTADKVAALAITLGKLAIGASVNNHVAAAMQAGVKAGTSEATIGQTPNLTTRGGPVWLLSSGVLCAEASVSLTTQYVLRWYRVQGGTPTKLHEMLYDIRTPTGGLVVPVPVPLHVDTPAAGTYAFRLTAQTSSANLTVNTGQVGANGSIRAIELA